MGYYDVLLFIRSEEGLKIFLDLLLNPFETAISSIVVGD